MPAGLDKQIVLDFLRRHRQELSAKFGVRQIGIFGSFADDRQSSDSDIDFLVELESPDFDKLAALYEFLECGLDRPVDITRITPSIRTAFRSRIQSQAIYV